uniref:NAC domain-containing protein n=1 Tax=Leersia perrieri TaxID=77586 RepID=A0A0D9V162_9ORYZ
MATVPIRRKPIEVAVKVQEEKEGILEVVDPRPPSTDDQSSQLSPSGVAGFEETPTADELVLRHLLPRLRGFRCPDGDVPAIAAKDDPHAAEAPRDLVARHGGRADRRRGEAFYFAPRWRRRRHVLRTVAAGGGLWKHSSTSAGESVTFLGGVVLWRATRYCFYERGDGCGAGIRAPGGGCWSTRSRSRRLTGAPTRRRRTSTGFCAT